MSSIQAVPQSLSVRSEYPRPRMARSEWMSLNGTWEFEFDELNAGPKELVAKERLSGSIQVPFAYQTELSGIDDKRICEVVWYAREFTVPSDWKGKSVLLHFGGVDYESTIWINGTQIGSHRGGYSPFTMDVTGLLVTAGSNRVTVRVVDLQDPGQPRGKQSSDGKPHGIDYWCTTGIWQSVWLEPVSNSYVGDLVVTPDLSQSCFLVSTVVYGSRADVEVMVEVFDGEAIVASQRSRETLPSEPMRLVIPSPKLWSDTTPHLYDLRVTLSRNGQLVDQVLSYAGMRSIEVRNGSVLLNGKSVFLKMVLDQGYWPDGGLTAPSDEALRRDVELVKELGFNAARKHQKVEDPRWLYWCDRLGLLVWGEMANSRAWSFETQERLEAEWTRVIERDRSHPCIIAWVPLNESMGFPELGKGDARQRVGVERLVHLTRRLDATRPIIDNDGWEQTDSSDIVAIHDYSHSGAELAARYKDHIVAGGIPTRIWTGSRISLLPGVQLAGRPIILTEVGGFLTLPESDEKLDGMYNIYNSFKTGAEVQQKYAELMEAIASLPFLSGFCYTQFTDVEQEQNGLLAYDRTPKVDPQAIKAIHDGMRPALLEKS